MGREDAEALLLRSRLDAHGPPNSGNARRSMGVRAVTGR
jgi:hypothetical protein